MSKPTERRKGAGQRVEQVNALIQERVSAFLIRHVEIPGVLVTVTYVDTAADLHNATVFVSVLPASRRGSTMEKLRHLNREANAVLFKELTMRPVPKIHFALDEQAAHAASIEDLLDSIADPEA